jgi:futalosine hydrolase
MLFVFFVFFVVNLIHRVRFDFGFFNSLLRIKMAMDTLKQSGVFALMAALPGEGELILQQCRIVRTETKGDLEICRGTFADKEILVAFSGLGKVNAAAAAAAILSGYSVSRLWMWGSGGAYDLAGVEIGDVALASEEILGDEGVATISSWQPLDAIGISLIDSPGEPIFNRMGVDPLELKRSRHLLGNWQRVVLAPRIHVGPFVTVSAVSGSAARARLLSNRYGALCENMEGGAVAQVCLRYRVPFMEIRGLSNRAGDRGKKRWQLTKAVNNCQRALLFLLENWDKE